MNVKSIKSYALALLFIALSLTGCKEKTKNPVVESLISTIVWATGADENKVFIYDLEQVRKVTIGEELDYRIGLFQYKLSFDKGKLEYFSENRMPRNRTRYAALVKKDERILQGLDSLRADMDAGMAARVAWYEFKFSAKAETPDEVFNVIDWHFIITPRYKIVAMKSHNVGLRRGMGKLIPGYMSILGREELSDEDLEIKNVY